MDKKVGKKTEQSRETELPKVESYLESTFKPVSPRPDFVVNLRSRLDDPEFVNRRETSDLNLLLLIFGAVGVTVLVVVGLVKLIVELMGASHILRLAGRQVDTRNILAGQEISD
jgi:hypothetical protein